MPSPQQVQTACQRCRKKRAKCDSHKPCQRCEGVGEKCEYSHSRRTSKNELRAEIERLKKSIEGCEKHRRTLVLAEDSDAYQTVSRGMTHSNRSHEHGLKGSVEDRECSTSLTSDAARGRKFHAESTITRSETSGTLSCFDQLFSWGSCHPTFGDPNLSPLTTESSTTLSLPPPPVDAYTTLLCTDTWTRTGWTRAHIRHLFDVVITWDYISFSILRRDRFLHDYESGAVQFCSSALVHAILALATRLVNENDDESEVLSSGWFGSKIFFDEATAILQGCGLVHSLPDIQALGFLSLYQFRRGQETQARELADVFATSIRDFCRREPLAEPKDKQYCKVRSTTYCGAASLIRMLSLTTGRLFNVLDGKFQEELLLSLDESNCSSEKIAKKAVISHSPSLATNANNVQFYSLQVITSKIFQLTELVYKLIISTRTGPQAAPSDVVAAYTKYLEWYEDLFAHLGADGGRTPFILFVHIYYHFCLLCAFRPFINRDLGDSDIQPHEICSQAVRSILTLTQSYDDLFTLRRVSGLVPYIVCASGLFSIALEDKSPYNDSMTKLETTEQQLNTNSHIPSNSPSHTKVPAVAHARLLLAKMGATHPAAILAETKLRESLQNKS